MDIIDLCRTTARKFPDDNPKKLASKVYEKVSKAGLMSLLIETIQAFQREVVRDREHSVFLNDKFDNGPVKINVEEGFRKLFNSRVSLGDGRFVAWGAATIKEHKERINYLKKMRDGLEQTIRFHEKAIEIIRSNRVKCLKDIPEEKLKKLI